MKLRDGSLTALLNTVHHEHHHHDDICISYQADQLPCCQPEYSGHPHLTIHQPPSAWAWPRVARCRKVPTHVTHFLFTEEDAEEERCCKYPSTVIWAITIDKVVRMICTRCIGSDHIMEIIHSSSSIFGYNLVYLIYECLLLCCIHECILVLNIASCSRIRGFNM